MGFGFCCCGCFSKERCKCLPSRLTLTWPAGTWSNRSCTPGDEAQLNGVSFALDRLTGLTPCRTNADLSTLATVGVLSAPWSAAKVCVACQWFANPTYSCSGADRLLDFRVAFIVDAYPPAFDGQYPAWILQFSDASLLDFHTWVLPITTTAGGALDCTVKPVALNWIGPNSGSLTDTNDLLTLDTTKQPTLTW